MACHEQLLTFIVCETVLLSTGEAVTDVGSAAFGTGDNTGSGCGTNVGAGAGTISFAGAAEGGGTEDTVPLEITPLSRSTNLGAAVFPEKNSEAVSAGSSDGAGGKMSDWKDSDWSRD